MVHLICNISGSLEEVSAFFWWKEVAGLCDGLEQRVEGTCFQPSQMCFELIVLKNSVLGPER